MASPCEGERHQVAHVPDLDALVLRAGPRAPSRRRSSRGSRSRRSGRAGRRRRRPGCGRSRRPRRRCPLTSRPSAMMPSPRPVEALTTRTSLSRHRLAEQLRAGEHVGVVGEVERGVADAGEVRRELDAVPAAHDGRVQADPALGVDGAGQAQPDPSDRPASTVAQRARRAARRRPGSSSSGPDADGVVAAVARDLAAVEVEHARAGCGSGRPRRASTTPASTVEQQAAGRPAAGGGELLARRAAGRRRSAR